MSGRRWTSQLVRPANLDADGRPWTFWKHSQGAGIETRAAHHTNERSRSRIPTVATTAKTEEKKRAG
jgi:hypothetical protein